ncbi:unnamed protein product, partial [Brassica oleracea var. botrytis]
YHEHDDPEQIRLEAERDKSVLNGRDTETINSTDATQEVKEHIVNLEPNEMHQEESELNAIRLMWIKRWKWFVRFKISFRLKRLIQFWKHQRKRFQSLRYCFLQQNLNASHR